MKVDIRRFLVGRKTRKGKLQLATEEERRRGEEDENERRKTMDKRGIRKSIDKNVWGGIRNRETTREEESKGRKGIIKEG